ncbi:M60 family peptidase N-terminal accessory domain-containing protein, partial [Pseudomonas moraviensis]|uniref:M60 family peptidase N-terminal accessory domain-containing protein n=1 Tax=Pseudomonas moraviensis TaxID=321662 RepID=UPI00273BB2E4
MITYAKQIGLALNVQIMAMDYGASGLDMGASAVSAIDATKNNLARIYPDKSSADLYKMIGVIPMIGQNDTAGEMFSFADATKTALYAKQQKLNLVSMWSLGRDFPGSGDLSTCTQNPAQTKDYEYTTTFLNALADDSESDPDKGNVFHVEQHGDPYALNDLQRRQSVPAPIQSTGYWAKAGDVLTVEYVLSGNTPTDAPQIWIHCIVEGSDPAQEYYNDKQKVPLAAGVNKINVAKTGVVYIASNNIPDPAVNMQITIV